MKFTNVCYNISPEQLINSINWLRASGHYVVQDPNNGKLLLYLDDKQYNRLVITAISADKLIVVLSTPDDSQEDVLKRFVPSSSISKENSPHLTWEYKASKMFSFYPGWKVKESMISFERNFKYFLPSYYKDIISWLGSKTTKRANREIILFSLTMDRIYKTRGINNLINILKIYSIVILQYLSGKPLTTTQDLGQRVKLIKGLPAGLPVFFRHLLRQNNITQVRAIISLCQSYKGLQGVWKEPDLSSIMAPRFVRADKKGFDQTLASMQEIQNLLSPNKLNHKMIPVLNEDWREVNSLQTKFWEDFNPSKIKATLLTDKEHLKIPLTAGPNHRTSVLGSSVDALAIMANDNLRSLWFNFFVEAEYVAKLQGTFFPSKELSLIKLLTEQANLLLTKLLSNDREVIKLLKQISFLKVKYLKSFTTGKPDRAKFVAKLLKELRLGKLAIKLEPAGKVRVFAISDFWTQNMMAPLHSSLFEVLKRHSSDATFNQEGKVNDFKNKGYSFIASYDLKSATDLIPVQLYEKVIGHWTTPAFASAWSALLTKREYIFKNKSYKYTRGQPMGTLSSWASLALVHHFLVFMAAHRAGIKHFRDYLVLGDDIVIANKLVAEQYCLVCKDYGITIGLPKSFVSDIGMFQFASQNIVGNVNISPISLKEVLSCSSHSYLFKNTYNVSKRLEWLDRLLRKGFIDSSKLVNLLRPLFSHNEYQQFSKSLSKGIIPSNKVNLIASVLSKLYNKLDNRIDINQFIASLRGDYNLFTNTIKYSFDDSYYLTKMLFKHFKSDFMKAEKELGGHLELGAFNKAFASTLPGVLNVLHPALLNSNSTTVEQYMKIRIEFYKLLTDLQSSLTEEMWSVMYDGQAGRILLDMTKIRRMIELTSELEALCVRKEIFKQVITSVDTKVPYLVKLHLSLLTELDNSQNKEKQLLNVGSI